MTEDIAIVGMSIEVPGATTIGEFADLVTSGRSMSAPFPTGRRNDIENYVEYLRATAVKLPFDTRIAFHDGYFLEDIASFDPAFFGMTPRQAAECDPHQRMILRNFYRALEDAGYTGARREKVHTGVFVGFAVNPGQTYIDYLCRADPSLAQRCLTGNITTMLANRLSYQFDLHGPSFVMDSACSASLVAVHQAKNALLAGDCDMAVVGGTRIALTPLKNADQLIGIESPDGVTRTFDDDAAGTGLGEGSGVVVLRRLTDALDSADQIYAVIKGSAVNHDGHSEMITAPDAGAQADLLTRAWADAGVEPRDVEYVEVHGTATRVGDPIEIDGLTRAFAPHTTDRQFCAVGTAKANVGHLFEGSGVIGLIKAALTVCHGVIPPLANFRKENTAVNFQDSPVYIPRQATTWEPDGHPRTGGVSAYGLGGTNCHVVLQQPPPRPRTQPDAPAEVCALSAASPSALRALLADVAAHLTENTAREWSLSDVCFTSRTARSEHRCRLVVVADSVDELADALAKTAEDPGTARPRVHTSVDGWSSAAVGDIDDPELSTLLAEYLSGARIDWALRLPTRGGRIVHLPPYRFDEQRCWTPFPTAWSEQLPSAAPAATEPNPVTHTVVFEEELPGAPVPVPEPGILMLIDPRNVPDGLLAAAPAGTTVLQLADVGGPADDTSFVNSEDDLQRVAAAAVTAGYSHIVHAVGLDADPVGNDTELRDRVRKNLHSLFRLAKGLMTSGARTRLVVLTRDAIPVHDGDPVTAPENSALAALARVVAREFPYLQARSQDVEAGTDPERMWVEIMRPETGVHVLRDGTSYTEVFREAPEPDSAGSPEADYLTPGGTYLITGGTGALGLAVAEFFARSAEGLNLVLAGRSRIPARTDWPALLAAGNDDRQTRLIAAVTRIEQLGSRVRLESVDAANPSALRTLADELTGDLGQINGIVHAAGLPGKNRISLRSEEDFDAVVGPKIYGGYALGQIAANVGASFLVHFSSVAVVFPAVGQGDYAAANYYLDTLAVAGRPGSCRVLTVDWVAWQEIGMAVDYGTNGDTTFKALPTAQAIDILDGALRAGKRRVFAGEINYDGDLIQVLPDHDITLDDTIVAKVKNAEAALQERLRVYAERKRAEITEFDVTLTGRDNGEYSAAEIVVAQCFRDAFGYETFNINDDFFNIGGDSIMATSVAANIATCLGVEFDTADLLMERTIADAAECAAWQLDDEG